MRGVARTLRNSATDQRVTSSEYVAAVSVGMGALVSLVTIEMMANLVAGGGGAHLDHLSSAGWFAASALASPVVTVIMAIAVRAARVGASFDGGQIHVRGVRCSVTVPLSTVQRIEYLPYTAGAKWWNWARVAIVFPGVGGEPVHAVVASTRLLRDARDKAYEVWEWFGTSTFPEPVRLEKYGSFTGAAAPKPA